MKGIIFNRSLAFKNLSVATQLQLKNLAAYFVLFILTIYTYQPYFTLQFLGTYDAIWYQRLLTDAVIQAHHHFFPSYIGQSDFNYFGVTLIRAPLLIFLAQGIDFLSFHHLPMIAILHATVIISALLGSFVSYFLLRKILVHSRMMALTLAFLYISAPGAIVLIYQFDMYFSFMALPFIPMAIYSLITFPKNLWWGIFGLSLTWMAHPPLAILLTGISFIYLCLHLIQTPRDVRYVIKLFFWVAILSSWQVISIMQLQVNTIPPVEDFTINAAHTVQLLLNDIPWVFSPFSYQNFLRPITILLQTGYSLWACVFLYVYCCLKNRTFIDRKLFFIIFLLIILLYPISIFKYLWYLFPRQILILFEWPMERFYLVLSCIICFAAALAVTRLSINKVLLCITMLICIMWNIHETNFVKNYLFLRTGKFNVAQPVAGKYYYRYGIQPTQMKFSRGYYEPALKNKLFDSQMKTIPAYDLEEQLKQECLKHTVKIIGYYSMNPPMPYPAIQSMPQAWTRIQIPNDQQQVLCIHTQSTQAQAYFVTIDHDEKFMEMLDINELGPTGLMFLFDHTADHPLLEMSMESWGKKLKVDFIGHTTYNLDQLPIKTISTFPLKIELTNPKNNTYLEIFKIYYPGYLALVNDKKIAVKPTKDNLVLIPLASQGHTRIELTYRGPPLMQWVFYLTCLMWLIAFFKARKSAK